MRTLFLALRETEWGTNGFRKKKKPEESKKKELRFNRNLYRETVRMKKRSVKTNITVVRFKTIVCEETVRARLVSGRGEKQTTLSIKRLCSTYKADGYMRVWRPAETRLSIYSIGNINALEIRFIWWAYGVRNELVVVDKTHDFAV